MFAVLRCAERVSQVALATALVTDETQAPGMKARVKSYRGTIIAMISELTRRKYGREGMDRR